MCADCPWSLGRIKIAIVVMGNFSNHRVIARKSFWGSVVDQGDYEF